MSLLRTNRVYCFETSRFSRFFSEPHILKKVGSERGQGEGREREEWLGRYVENRRREREGGEEGDRRGWGRKQRQKERGNNDIYQSLPSEEVLTPKTKYQATLTL